MSTENQGGDPIAAAREVDKQDDEIATTQAPAATTRAVAKAIGQGKQARFDDYSQSLAGMLLGQEELNKRTRAAIGERRADAISTSKRQADIASTVYKAAMDEITNARDKMLADLDDEEHDLDRAHSSIQAALDALA